MVSVTSSPALARSSTKFVSGETRVPPTDKIWSPISSAPNRSAGDPGLIESSTVAPFASNPTPIPSDSCLERLESRTSKIDALVWRLTGAWTGVDGRVDARVRDCARFSTCGSLRTMRPNEPERLRMRPNELVRVTGTFWSTGVDGRVDGRSAGACPSRASRCSSAQRLNRAISFARSAPQRCSASSCLRICSAIAACCRLKCASIVACCMRVASSAASRRCTPSSIVWSPTTLAALDAGREAGCSAAAIALDFAPTAKLAELPPEATPEATVQVRSPEAPEATVAVAIARRIDTGCEEGCEAAPCRVG